MGIPEEVQPGKRRTTNCVSDLGQVTLKGNAQTEDPLKVKKYNGGLSSCGVGARRSSGRSPASSWVGRPAGGARSFAPLFGSLLSSREIAHGVSLSCLPATSAGFLSYRRYLVVRDSWRLTPLVLQQSRFAVASNAEHSSI